MPEDTRETRRDSTDLIDVSDVAAEMDEATPAPAESEEISQAISEPSLEPKAMEGPAPASLMGRFAAFAIDAIVLYVIYWFMMIGYRAIAFESAAGPLPARGLHGLIFHGLFLLVAFLYFLLFESVSGATPGKMICSLRLLNVRGQPPSIGACFLRNILLPVDIVLAPFVIPFASMEWTRRRMRLGDLVARTTVIRTLSSPRREFSLTLDMLPSASGRLLAFSIDLILFALLVVGYALLLTPESPLFSMMLIVLFPVVAALFFFIPEAVARTSLGKWLFGYAICNEDGSRLGTSGAFTRTFFRLFDLNPFGFLTILFSIRHQRPGDVAAGTVVCKAERQWKSLICIALTATVVLALLYAGISNRTNLLSSDFEINFLPSADMGSVGGKRAQRRPSIFTVKDFAFAAGSPDAKRSPALFKPGDKVFLVFSVMGGTRKDDKLWIQEDLTVRYPDGSTGLKLDNIIDFHEPLERPGPIELTNNIAIPEDAMPGRYVANIVIRDKNADRQITEQRFFYVTPKNQPTGKIGEEE
jgi:uncharacterized RDD family membrane protein YckC